MLPNQKMNKVMVLQEGIIMTGKVLLNEVAGGWVSQAVDNAISAGGLLNEVAGGQVFQAPDNEITGVLLTEITGGPVKEPGIRICKISLHKQKVSREGDGDPETDSLILRNG